MATPILRLPDERASSITAQPGPLTQGQLELMTRDHCLPKRETRALERQRVYDMKARRNGEK